MRLGGRLTAMGMSAIFLYALLKFYLVENAAALLLDFPVVEVGNSHGVPLEHLLFHVLDFLP